MENSPQEEYSREAFEALEKDIADLEALAKHYSDDEDLRETLHEKKDKLAKLLDEAHAEALIENEQRDRQGTLPLE